MTLADTRQNGEPELAEQLAAEVAVHQVGRVAVAVDGGRMAEVDAHVVEHGPVGQYLQVGTQLGMLAGGLQRTVHHLAAMREQELAERRIVGVVLVNDLYSLHGGKFEVRVADSGERSAHCGE